MTEQELRQLVREAIARHGGREAVSAAHPAPARGGHFSQGIFPLSRGSDDDGLCVIEPAVRCTHCGYCLSYGH